jgi:hypothetical protein
METIPLSFAGLVIYYLGMSGLIFIIWHFDAKRFQKQEDLRREQLQIVLNQYREDVSAIKQLYESNVRLVTDVNRAFERLEKIYDETISVISLNTQTQANLTNAIQNNQYCPAVRRIA